MAGVRNQFTRGDMQELGLLGQQKQILMRILGEKDWGPD
jgi:hypothetical protein